MRGAKGWVCALLAAALLVAAFGASAAAAAPAAPRAGFYGVVPQAPPSARDLSLMEGVVGTLRIPIFWAECEPAPGVHDFAALDAQVGAAAAHGIKVQPFVYGTPGWLAAEQARPPLGSRASAAWASFLRTLVRRYGNGGEFWRGQVRKQPIGLWQVWNEPNFVLFWKPWPNPAAYARLLRVSAQAIRGADPRARIVLAGVAPVNAGIRTWVFLRRLFRVGGVERDFDIAAVHPYSTTLPELEYQLRKVRGGMAAAGLGKRPLLVTELGVASQGTYPSAFVRGTAGQAKFLRDAYARLLEMRRSWRIAGVDWFTWQDGTRPDPHCAFCEGAGLIDASGRPKPAWWALREVARPRGHSR
jgi:hypothetical protein